MADSNANTTALTAPLPSTAADLAPVASAPVVSDAAQAAPPTHIQVAVHKSIGESLKTEAEDMARWWSEEYLAATTLLAGVKRHWVAIAVFAVLDSAVTLIIRHFI